MVSTEFVSVSHRVWSYSELKVASTYVRAPSACLLPTETRKGHRILEWELQADGCELQCWKLNANFCKSKSAHNCEPARCLCCQDTVALKKNQSPWDFCITSTAKKAEQQRIFTGLALASKSWPLYPAFWDGQQEHKPRKDRGVLALYTISEEGVTPCSV